MPLSGCPRERPRWICADDHDAVFAGTGSAAQRQGHGVHAFAFDAGFVHGVAAIGRHRHDDFLGVVALLFGIGHGQGQL